MYGWSYNDGGYCFDDNMIRVYGDEEIDYRRASSHSVITVDLLLEILTYFVLMDDTYFETRRALS